MATNPSVRKSLNALKNDDVAIARLINKTVKPSVRVLKKDVAPIKELMQQAFGPRAARAGGEDGGEGTLNRFDDPPWDDVKLRR